MLIVNLNIRGVGGSTKARYLRKIIASEGANFVCIQETKLSTFTDARGFSLWRDNNVGWVHYRGDNGSGSLLTMWHKDVFSYESHEIGKGFIVVVGQHFKCSRRCVVVNVYSACSLREKIALWGNFLLSKWLLWTHFGAFVVTLMP